VKVFFGLTKKAAVGNLKLAIGVFDGLHLGHQAVLKRLKALGGSSGVLTFDGLPERVLAPDYAPPEICSLEQKLALLKELGLKRVFVQRFDRRFASQSAEKFSGLLKRLGACEIVVGSDFVFGARAAGDAELLRSLGFKVHVVNPVFFEGRPVSSTRIRHAIVNGRMDLARRMLGRPFGLTGRVKRGARLGRRLGYPTANVALEQDLRPKMGVWGGKARVLPKGKWRPMLANLGVRPSVDGKKFVCEVHLLDFEGDLYGKRLEVEPVLYLRPERRFASLEALKKQIRLDESRFRRTRAFASARRYSGAGLGQRRF
jgi:riboflavin kinase/FMN adenylyltransferase